MGTEFIPLLAWDQRALSTSAGESVLVSGPGLPSSWAENEVSLFLIAPLAPQGYAEEQEVVLGPTEDDTGQAGQFPEGCRQDLSSFRDFSSFRLILCSDVDL